MSHNGLSVADVCMYDVPQRVDDGTTPHLADASTSLPGSKMENPPAQNCNQDWKRPSWDSTTAAVVGKGYSARICEGRAGWGFGM